MKTMAIDKINKGKKESKLASMKYVLIAFTLLFFLPLLYLEQYYNFNGNTSSTNFSEDIYNSMSEKDNRIKAYNRAIALNNGSSANSCVYFLSEVLRMNDVEIADNVCNTTEILDIMKNEGWKKERDCKKLKRGDVVFTIELIEQSIAEYSDSEVYNNKNLTFIFRPYAKKIEMNLDGKKMSRVFENLINNALKYSLDNSRVFVEIESITETKDTKQRIKISFKNISCTALDFNKEEIFERFTRGDTSRNSNIDGSGLGLAIAKSIVELHGGKMYIDFDGDMFKVIIEL